MKSVLLSSLGWFVALAVSVYALWPQPARDSAQLPAARQTDARRWNPPFAFPTVGSATETALRIGDVLPPINCVDLKGASIDFDSLYGEKATLVICWATWCSPCMQGLPHEVQLARAFHSKGLRVIGVNCDHDASRAQAAVALLEIPWPNVHDPDRKRSPGGFLDSLKIKSFPMLLLFDRDRKLVMASPNLRHRTITPDPAGTMYAVDCLDWALLKMLGPLESKPFLTPIL